MKADKLQKVYLFVMVFAWPRDNDRAHTNFQYGVPSDMNGKRVEIYVIFSLFLF